MIKITSNGKVNGRTVSLDNFADAVIKSVKDDIENSLKQNFGGIHSIDQDEQPEEIRPTPWIKSELKGNKKIR